MMDTYWLEGIRGSVANQQDEKKSTLKDEVKDPETETSKIIKE